MAHEGASMLRDGVLLLGFALAFVLLFRRFGLGATLGYLIAGAVVGPQVLGLVGDAEQMITVAELGIVMLLFVVGLELDPKRLWRMKTAIFGLGAAQVVACGLAVTAVIYFAASYPLAAALAIGLPLGLSSTAQVLPMLDLGVIAENPFFVVSMAIALIAVKTLIILAIGLAVGMAWRAALALGLLLSQGGEFGFVLFTQAQNGSLISGETSSLFGAIVTLSMAATPFLMMAASRMRQPGSGNSEREGPNSQGRSDGATALVIGYGRFGQTVSQMMTAAGIRVTLIDSKVDQIDVAEEFGAKVYYGDGTRMDLLRQAGASEATVIAFCIDKDQLTTELLEGVREAFPQASVFVRAFDRRTIIKLRGAQVQEMVREVMESAVVMGRAALTGLGLSLQEIERAENSYRTRDKERLDLQLEGGDLRAGKERFMPWEGGQVGEPDVTPQQD